MILKQTKFIYFHWIVMACGVAATIVNAFCVAGRDFVITEGIVVSIIVVIYISALQFFRTNDEDNREELRIDEFEKRGKLLKAELIDERDEYWEYDVENDAINISEKWMLHMGYDLKREEIITEIIKSKMLLEDRRILRANLNDYLEGKTPALECDFRMLDNKGRYSWFNIKGIKREEGAGKKIIAGIVSDITSRKNIEEKINYMAFYDTLTGLPNKTYFQTYLKNVVETRGEKELKGALILIDIDDFKNVNDTLGHDYGDQLLKIVAELLKVTFGDTKIIVRIGGDEFLLLVEEYKEDEEVIEICEGIIRMLDNPIEIGDKSLYTSVSMGITFYVSKSLDIPALIKNAETAMYKSKETGKNKYSFYDLSMGSELERKMKIGNLLREAISKNELSIVYQPQFDIRTNKILSMEALIRWNNKELGHISPAEFIHIAEGNGTISAIGKWVLEEVCKQISLWKTAGYKYNSIAVNISPVQLQDETFVTHIKDTIIANKIDPGTLEIEITESLLLGNLQLSERKLHAVKNFGVKIAIDDFGTGYSALNYLTFLPLDTLKIDKSFIDNITVLNNDRILAQNIIKLSHDLKIKVVAEGVETKEQLDVLNCIDCDIIQGYYLSKPLRKEEIEAEFDKAVEA